MASLAHPNVVAVFDIRRDDRDLFLVMELITGGTLWDWVRNHGPMPPRVAVQVMLPVLRAVGAAHDAGVIHRDLKPHNIMLDGSGDPKVADFGIAHVNTPLADGAYTRTGTVLGTWAYMAPEQRHSARKVDERTDLYSLGATLFSLLTAEPPFDLFAADQDTQLLEGIPAPLADQIRRATRYNPEDRFQTATEMSEALEALLADLPAIPTDSPRLGSSPHERSESADATAAFSATDTDMDTGGPAADLLFGQRQQRSDPFAGEEDVASFEVASRWKLLAIVGPALIAGLAGGLVMLSQPSAPSTAHEVSSSVVVEGDALQVILRDDQGRDHAPGPLAPGRYALEARFEGSEQATPAGDLELEDGATVTLRCQARTASCEVEPAP